MIVISFQRAQLGFDTADGQIILGDTPVHLITAPGVELLDLGLHTV